MTRLQLRGLLILCFLMSILGILFITLPALGHAASFQLTNLTQNSGLRFSAPSINSAGLIFAYAETPSGASDMFLVDKAGTITNLTQSRFSTVLGGSINDKGEVAFHADGDVIFFDGTSFQNLTNGVYTIDASALLGRTVNDSGQVAFGTNIGLIFFDGAQFQDVTAGLGNPGFFLGNQPPSLNNDGQIAFTEFVGTTVYTFLFDGISIINLSNDPDLQIFDTGGFPVINDKGEVLFFGGTTISGSNTIHLFLFDGSTTIDLTTAYNLPQFGSINAVAFNDHGHIAFIAEGDQLWFVANQQVQKITEGVAGAFMTMNDSATIAFVKGNDLFVAGLIEPITEQVSIEIKPGSADSPIDPKSTDVIPVAILTTDTFDATIIDPLSVEFGPNGATEAHERGHIEDANKDGRLDLVLHFNTQETGIQCGDTSASLTGQTFSGQEIEGTDAIRTVGCN